MNIAHAHHYCGPCQSEGAVRMVPTDDERFEQWFESASFFPRKVSARRGWNAALKQISKERDEARRTAAELEEANAKVANQAGQLRACKEELAARQQCVANKDAEIKRLTHVLAGARRDVEAHLVTINYLRASSANGTLSYMSHSCPPPLGNPTREEAIAALKRIRTQVPAIVDALLGYPPTAT